MAMAGYFNSSSGNSNPAILLFGGADATGRVYNDTWQFNVSAATWWNVTPYLKCSSSSPCPSARHDASMVGPYDNNGPEVMFGGCSSPSPGYTEAISECSSSSSSIFGDTWTYTYNTSSTMGVGKWTKLNESKAPSQRFGAGFSEVVGSLTETALLFGGCGPAPACPLNDSWALTPALVWKNVTPVGSSPSVRYGTAMSPGKIPPDYGVFLFGGCSTSLPGCNSTGGTTGALNDTWFFDQSTGTWSELITPATCRGGHSICPPQAYDMGYTYDGAETLLIYGGAGPGGVVYGDGDLSAGDFWYFSSAGWGDGKNPHGGLPLHSWSGSYPLGPPAERYDTGFAEATAGDDFLLFGGSSTTGSSLGDSWVVHPSIGGAPPFEGLVTPSPTPFGALGASIANYSAKGYSVMFGGCGVVCSNQTNQTWEYNASNSSGRGGPWNSSGLTVGSPPPRYNASMIYFNLTGTTTEQAVLLFGGVGPNGTLLNDLWIFQNGGWKRAGTSTPPPPLESAGFVYDAHDQEAVLFGGFKGTTDSGATYSLTYGTGTPHWTWTTVGGTGPSARHGMEMVYDQSASDHDVVLYGGCGFTCPLGDTWTFSAGSWNQCTGCTGTNTPTALWGGQMVFDANAAVNKVLLTGGCAASACPQSSDWTFSGTYSTGTWASFSPTGTAPPARYDAVIVYEAPPAKYVLEWGGVGAHGVILGEQAWALNGTVWFGGSAPNQLPQAQSPSPRFGASLAYNSSADYVLLVGGCQASLVPGCGPLTTQADTWEFQNGSWKWICSGCGPSARWDSALAYDTIHKVFVLFGGAEAQYSSTYGTPSTAILGDTWMFDGSWTSLTSTPTPHARADATFTYDPADAEFVLFGGLGCGIAPVSICSDTWTYAYSGAGWTHLSPATHPSGRFGGMSTYASSPGEVFLFGGANYTSGGGVAALGDTWEFLHNAWTLLASSGLTPTPRFDGVIGYDTSDKCVFLFGGTTISSSKPLNLNDTKVWCGSGPWAPPPAVSGAPSPRWGMAMVYDPAAGPAGMFVMIGGANDTRAFTATTPIIGAAAGGYSETWQLLPEGSLGGTAVWAGTSPILSLVT